MKYGDGVGEVEIVGHHECFINYDGSAGNGQFGKLKGKIMIIHMVQK